MKPTPGRAFGEFINDVRAQARITKNYHNLFIPIRAYIIHHARSFFPDKIYESSWVQETELNFYTKMGLILGNAIVPTNPINIMNGEINAVSTFKGQIYTPDQPAPMKSSQQQQRSITSTGKTHPVKQPFDNYTTSNANKQNFPRQRYRKRGYIWKNNKRSRYIYNLDVDPTNNTGSIVDSQGNVDTEIYSVEVIDDNTEEDEFPLVDNMLLAIKNESLSEDSSGNQELSINNIDRYPSAGDDQVQSTGRPNQQ